MDNLTISNTKTYHTYLVPIEPAISDKPVIQALLPYQERLLNFIIKAIGEQEYISTSQLKDAFRWSNWKNYSALFGGWQIREFMAFVAELGFKVYVVHAKYKETGAVLTKGFRITL